MVVETILVWILVTINPNRIVSYSPPLATLETCQSLQKNLPRDLNEYDTFSRCIQLRVPNK